MDPFLLVAQTATGGSLWIAYVGFVLLVVFFLALDLGVFHREAHEVAMKEAAGWSVVWVTLGLMFGVFVYFGYENHWFGLGESTRMYNPQASEDPSAPLIIYGVVDGWTAATQYVTGYLVEKSLAMDNIFVIAILFGFFAVPAKYQHRVLFWGIVGALVMRGAMILIGGELIIRYQWILILFGAFLLLTAVKMALIRSESDPSRNIVVRMITRIYPVAPFFDGQRFFTRRTIPPTYSTDASTGRLVQDPPAPGTLSSKWLITPLFLALIMVEVTDLVFAVDSIPAIFAITPDPFIVFTSNIFAILGLRALYFCLAALIAKFWFLKPALIIILGFVGVKLLLLSLPPYAGTLFGWMGISDGKSVKIDPLTSLIVVVVLLLGAVAMSVWVPRKPHVATPVS